MDQKKKQQPKTHKVPVTLDDIAQVCGVSRMAVSYALRGQRQFVSAVKIERINKVALQMGYDPAVAHAARSLRYQKQKNTIVSYVVAVFFPVELINTRYYAILLQGIHQALKEKRFGMLSCYIQKNGPPVAEQLPQIFRRGDVDGAIIMPSAEYDVSLAESLHGMAGFGDRPIVSLIDPLAGCDAVVADDVEIGRLAATHLLELGHRHLLRFRNFAATNALVEKRLLGHQIAFKQAGLKLDPHLQTEGWIWDDLRGLEIALLEALEKHPKTTAILAPNDTNGIELARVLRRLGRRIPEDISIIGADDCDALYGSQEQNIWTTVRVPLQAIGHKAADRLIEQLAQEPAGPHIQTLPVELVVRGTTAAPHAGR